MPRWRGPSPIPREVKVSFRTAVEDTSTLQGAWRAGLQALTTADRGRISAQDPRRIDGSVDLDSHLKELYPNASRWDYAIGHKDNVVYWIEVHPASSGEIRVVLAKLRWLLDWLEQDAPTLDKFRKEIIWVSSGATSFTPSAPQRKEMAQQGLQQKGRFYSIPKQAAL